MAKFRNNEVGNFTMISNDFINDKNLSAKAKGVYIYLRSKKNDWQFYELEIVKNFSDGKHSISSAINELIDFNYLLRIQKRVEGKFSCYEWILNPTEKDFIDNGITDSRITETRKPDIGKTDTNNTNSSNTNNNNTNNIKTNNTKETSFLDNDNFFNNESNQLKDLKEKKEKSSAKKEKINYDEIKRIFNQVCVSLPKVIKMTTGRKTAIRSFLKDNTLIDLGDLFKQVEASDWLSGRKGDASFGFDWILTPKNTIKIQEGNYDNKESSKQLKKEADQMAFDNEFKKALQQLNVK